MDAGGLLSRYERQMLVPQIGREGQEKLAAAKVGVVGCGALGCMVAMHLVRAGVGLVRIVDRDCPELGNLHRQMLFTEDDVARSIPKAEAAAAFLAKANSQVRVEPVVATIDETTLPAFADDLDLLADGTDNFPTRFIVNEYAVARGKPWVYGGVIRTSGMSMTIVPGESPCLRCLVRELPSPEHSPTAATAGVLATVVALIGSVEANEVIKLVVDPASRSRSLLVLDVWDLTLDKLELLRDLDCPCCGTA